MSSPPPPPPPPTTGEDETAQAAESPIIISRTIMVGSAPPPLSRDNSSVGLLDLDDTMSTRSSNASTVKASGRGGSSYTSQNIDNTANFNIDTGGSSTQPHRRRFMYNIEDLVPISVADAGLNAYGCVFVEVWLMNSDGTALRRVEPGGHWIDPSFVNSLPSPEVTAKAVALDRYAKDVAPGVGLAGTLFNSVEFGSTRRVYWRQIREMLHDPFVQRGSGQRMKRLDEIGIGLVGAVPFSFQDENGLVLFFSRYNADLSRLRSSMNEGFLVGSTDLIGSQIAIQKNRKACAELRKEMFMEAVRKVMKEFQTKQTIGDLATSKSTLHMLAKQREEAQSPLEQEDLVTRVMKQVVTIGKRVLKRINNSRRKWKGTELEGPPRQSYGEAAFVIFGVFFTMLSVLKVANAIGDADSDFQFDAGWYASTLCIIFALTPAPVGQPRQLFAAHLWNMLVGLALRQIPSGVDEFTEWNSTSYGLPLIWKQALAVSLGVAGQAKLGILHPPATGLSYAFVTSDKYSWGTISSVYLADALVVALSVLILNLSEAKQYPIYWLGINFEWSYHKSTNTPPVNDVAQTVSRREVPTEGDDDNV